MVDTYVTLISILEFSMSKTCEMNGRVVLDTTDRRSAMSHPPVDPPLCLDCRQSDLALFDPSCPWCQEIVKNPKTAISEIFAIMRQWVPQTQKNIELFVGEILSRGAHVDDRDGLTDMTLLQYSCKAGAAAVGDVNSALKVVKMLIEKGANVHLRCRWTDMNALHYATHFDVAPILRFILQECKDLNVNIHCPNYDGCTALHIAAKNLCLEAAQTLLEYNADVNAKDNFSRIPYEYIPEVSSFCNLPDAQDKIIKMKKLLTDNSLSLAESTKNAKGNTVSGKTVLRALNLEINDEVIIDGCKIGTLRFCGTTEFASGLWAGVELHDSQGRNDGSVHGVTYFKCPPNKGVFVPVSKVCRVDKILCPKDSTSFQSLSKVQINHRKVDVSRITSKVCCGIIEGYEYRGLKVGDQVPFNRNNETQFGIIRFIGKTEFASGYWVGIELEKEASDRHDGMVEGIRYFECPSYRGLFILASKLLRNLAVYKQFCHGKENLVHKWRKGYALSRSQSLHAPNEGKRSSLLRSLSANQSLSRENAHPYILANGRNDFASLLGMTILYCHKLGVVRYIGQVEFAEGYWFGLEMKEQKGKHDGVVNGKRYFKCKPGHGIMVLPKNVTLLDVNADKLCRLLSN